MINKFKNCIFALLVALIGFFTYFQNYQYPSKQFWDENYNIANAQKYIDRVVYMHSHPPLGKLFIALGEKIPARAFTEEGAEVLAVSVVGEGVELRDAGFSQPIILLGGFFLEEAEAVVEYGLSPVVSCANSLTVLSRAAERLGKRVGVHLKIDTGMGRRGCKENDLDSLLPIIASSEGLVLEGILSHLSVADVDHHEAKEYTLQQLDRFGTVVERVRKAGFTPRWIHIANSAAIVWYPNSHHSLVRPGIVLYGGLKGFPKAREAMRVSSRLVEVKQVRKGACISYGRTFVAPKDMLVGIVPVGYATGYLRGFSNKGVMLLKGERVPVIGTVCMDLTLLDLSKVPDAAIGDEVVLLGSQGNASVSVFELANWLGTITYEVFCLLGNSVFAERVYL
jgi:alanine racemase